jgi:hypothetical protein
MRGCLLLLLTACRSDDEVEGRARALLEAARRAKAPEAPTEPVSLTVENLGVLRVDPGVDPADVVEAFYATALKQNVTLSLKNLTTILDKLCVLAPCRRRFHKERLTANVKGVGTLVVEPWVEPARAVAELGRAAESAGNPLGENQLRRVLDAVCEKRACVDALDRRLELNVTGVGRLVVEPWHDVADAIEGWTAAATMSGHEVNEASMQDLYEWCCKRRSCGRDLTPPLTLNVSGLGSVTCLPTEEPATAVERLASTAAEAYISVLPEQLDAAMAWFCARRSCHRPVAPMRLDVEGVGALEVPPWGEPAAAVAKFAREATAAGFEITEQSANKMLEFFCSRRSCRRTLPPPLTARVEPYGEIFVPPWSDPADVVEAFGASKAEKGEFLTAETMTKLMEAFCARRPCSRLSVKAPWLPTRSDPGEAAG